MKYAVSQADKALIEQLRHAFGGIGHCEIFLGWKKHKIKELRQGRNKIMPHHRAHFRAALESRNT